MKLNNLIASPSFKNWLEGYPLDIPEFISNKEGKPKHSIFYIAHLNDSERMFFVTLLFNQIISWMRKQSGTNSLRTLIYMDEIFGYFPPVSNPPSKIPPYFAKTSEGFWSWGTTSHSKSCGFGL